TSMNGSSTGTSGNSNSNWSSSGNSGMSNGNYSTRTNSNNPTNHGVFNDDFTGDWVLTAMPGSSTSMNFNQWNNGNSGAGMNASTSGSTNGTVSTGSSWNNGTASTSGNVSGSAGT